MGILGTGTEHVLIESRQEPTAVGTVDARSSMCSVNTAAHRPPHRPR